MQPEDNDVLYNEYGVDLLGLFEYLLEGILGIGLTPGSITDFFATAWDIFSLISFLVSLLFIIGIIYSYLRISEYTGLISERIELAEIAWREARGPKTDNDRWSEVLRHVGSERPNDWKLAIIEADIMLAEGLKERGYAGFSIGDQLKGLSPGQFASLQDAWDAHRVRNRIAHEGSDFVLTQGAAREAIVKYERALRELGVI